MIRVRWSSNAPQKAGDVTPTVSDNGDFVLPPDIIARVKAGEEFTAAEGDPVAEHIVNAVNHNIAQARTAAEEVTNG